jgi:hypothetical protein
MKLRERAYLIRFNVGEGLGAFLPHDRLFATFASGSC